MSKDATNQIQRGHEVNTTAYTNSRVSFALMQVLAGKITIYSLFWIAKIGLPDPMCSRSTAHPGVTFGTKYLL